MYQGETEYGLIGRKLCHSFSQQYFTQKFSDLNIDAVYHNFEIPDIDCLNEIISSNPHIKGLNVTIPYKESILPLLNRIAPTANKIGAVNTVKITGKELIGYNTDIIGFRDSIAPLIKEHHHVALILGTGGASKAIACGLEELGIKHQKVSRSPQPNQLSYADLTKEIINTHTIIINTTPLGTYPDTESAPPIPYHRLTDRHLCYDLVYNPELTTFLQKCRQQGCTIKNGYEMLIRQAEASWKIWNE